LPTSKNPIRAGASDVVLTLARPRTLEVRLVTVERKPVAGTVRVSGDHFDRSVAANDGMAIVRELFPGNVLVSAMAGELSSGPQWVTLASGTTSVTLVLERGGRLAVSVVDEQGQPVTQPSVELTTASGEKIELKKLSTGELARFGPVAVGAYVVRGQSDGYASASFPANVVPGETDLEIVLGRKMVIAGRVIDEYGRAAPGVPILIAPLGDSAVTAEDGRFRAAVPSAGLYTLQAHHSDWGGGEIKVAAPTEGIELELSPKAGCEVTVLAEGQRVEGASVVMATADGNFRSDRVSGADGVVLMRGMPANSYTLVATHPEFLASERMRVTVVDGQLAKVTAELKPGAQITGQVVDTAGAKVAGVMVSVQPRGAESVISDAEGRFVLGPVPPKGVYAVRASQRGIETAERASVVGGGPPVTITVKRQAVYRGRVFGEGQPLKRFRVDAHEVSSGDGSFQLPLSPSGDRLLVTVEAIGYEPMSRAVPNAPDLGDFNLRRMPDVTGVVKDEAGNGIGGAVVSCDACEQPVTTSSDGRFALPKPPFQKEFQVVAKKGLRTATRTATGDAFQGLQLVLKSGVSLTGTVYLPDGRPAAGVEVSGLQLDRNEPLTVVTNADGTYAVDVAPGPHRFSMNGPGVSRSGIESLATMVDISGMAPRLDFGPAPGTASVVVRVRPERGFALWLVRGLVNAVGNPPLELTRASYAQMLYQPQVDRVVFQELPAGSYTIVWANFHAPTQGGPLLRSVEVPAATEIELVR
jgi:hypothetical protein